VLTARATRALAFLGEKGWEAWTLSDTGIGERKVAEGCTRPGAVFTPNGRSLIVPGRVDGIWLLPLDGGQFNLMCDGNLGQSRRVPLSGAFLKDPLRLVTPQWDLDGYLQVVFVHVPGGSRNFNSGGLHHYGVAASLDGRSLAYVQAAFDEDNDEPFVEDIYLFDFERVDVGTEQIDSREGGRPRQGPCFVGAHSALVYLAAGEAIRIDIQSSNPASAGSTASSAR
jgi:hypothetical protein